MTDQSLDYGQVKTFWETVGNDASRDPDYQASQDLFLPEASQRRYRAAQMEFLHQHVLPRLPRDVRVLDLGCGPGVWALSLAPRVGQLRGIDLAPGFICHAREQAEKAGHRHLEFRVGSMLDFPTEQRYGLVMLGASLIYVDDADLLPLFQRIQRVLAPGGVVYVRTSVGPRTRTVRRSRCESVYRTAEHYEAVFRDAGFTLHRERDHTYTQSMLAAIYFGVGHYVTAGLLSRRPRWGARLQALVDAVPLLSYGLGGAVLDCTPVPTCFNYLLRSSHTGALPAGAPRLVAAS